MERAKKKKMEEEELETDQLDSPPKPPKAPLNWPEDLNRFPVVVENFPQDGYVMGDGDFYHPLLRYEREFEEYQVRLRHWERKKEQAAHRRFLAEREKEKAELRRNQCIVISSDSDSDDVMVVDSGIYNSLMEDTLGNPERSIISRRGTGTSGRLISLHSNHFMVSFENGDQIFHQYTVSITREDKKTVEARGIRRKIIDRLCQKYPSDINGKRSAYDGDKNFYTMSKLAQKTMEFPVLIEDTFAKREDGSLGNTVKQSKHEIYNVVLTHAAQIPLNSIFPALQDNGVDKTHDALRVLHTLLRQQAAIRGYLLARRSFCHDDARNLDDTGGGVTGCQGIYANFRLTQGYLSLIIDVSATATTTLRPVPVIDFLLVKQRAKGPDQIDWERAKRMLKNLRVKATHNGMESTIIGLSDKPCNQLHFPMKVKRRDSSNDEGQTSNITVYEYFGKYRKIDLSISACLRCLDVGSPKRPNYLPLELASLVSLQRYPKALSAGERASLVEQSRESLLQRKHTVNDALEENSYKNESVLPACGVEIDKKMIQVDGRVLEAPKLRVGNEEDCIPDNGRWNFNKKQLFAPVCIEHWAVVNFSSSCNIGELYEKLIACGRNKGIDIKKPLIVIEEDLQFTTAGPVARVDRMIKQITNMRGKLDDLKFILCVLPERRNCDVYGPWKKKCITNLGIVNQCLSPLKINDQYLTNVLLKINCKLGGINYMLASQMPLIKDIPTMILGMNVSYGPAGQSDIPSIAAVVGSLYWPMISNYRAAVRTQSPTVKMIESLYKPEDGNDLGIMRELLLDFSKTNEHGKPKQIVVFRGGVSESQFNQVLNIELEQIIKACQHFGKGDVPKFTVIVAQKNHHTKLFLDSANRGNVPPGTVVDTTIVHPRNYDFYMCAQAGTIGTLRPTHYHVLLDEIGFSPNELQNLIHSLSYVSQSSTNATSIVAPLRYALNAARRGKFMKVPDDTMFFC